MKRRVLCLGAVVFLAALFRTTAAWAQEILLDKGVKAGELQLFQDFSDPKVYHYVPDKVRLATGEDGKPQFSFLKYVSNVKSKPGEESIDEGEGGGIVHCLVQLGASEDQLAEARTELRRLIPGATIAGPIIFRSGKFGIVSSFKQEDGDWTTSVLGLGSAPILDGEKASISIRLTKMGAKILWESFQTATPDISFTFEMEMAGYRNPYEASLEANFDQIYKHRDFSAAFASTYLGFQIRDTLDDLRTTGAIKLVTKGDDAKMDQLIATAYGKICEMMFDKMESGAFAPDREGATNLIDKASQYLKNQRQDSRSGRTSWLDSITPGFRGPGYGGGVLAGGVYALAGIMPGFVPDHTGKGDQNPASGTVEATEQPSTEHQTETEEREAPAAEPPSTTGTSGTQTPAPTVTSDDGEEQPQVTPEEALPPAGSTQGGRRPAADLRERRPPAGSQSGQQNSGQQAAQRRSEPSFSLLAAYQMKTVHRSGKFTLSFKKFMSDNLQLRFDENIGNLSKLMKDPRHFAQVNLDDPMFKQHEISVYLDGQNAADFAGYVNYVTVRLRKTHGNGDQTNDEVRIDRVNFNENGNFFKLMYGWKGDNDRDKWMSYDYDTVWSFHGGKEVDLGWKKGSTSSLTVTPPYQKRTLHLEADPTAVSSAGVRLITVKLYYDLAGAEQMKQATLNPASGKLSQTLDYIRPADAMDYQYEITWRLKGGESVSSGRKKSSDDYIFCDELPEKKITANGGGLS